MKKKIFSILFVVVLVFGMSLEMAVPAAETAEANGVPNPSFATVSMLAFTTPSTEISIGWERGTVPHSGTDAIHVTTSTPTSDYAMVIVPTDFTLETGTSISYWGYTVSGDVKALDEIYLFLDTDADEAADTILLSHQPGPAASAWYGEWHEWTLDDATNQWHTYPYELADLADYTNGTYTVLAIALTAGPSTTSGAVNVDVYFDELTVNGVVLLDDDTGIIDVPVPLPGFAASSIQDAIDAALPGDTITVAEGTYSGGTNPKWAIYIDKPIMLLGAHAGVDARNRSGAESIIDATGYGVGIYVVGEGDHTVIDGFEVKNSGYVDERGAGIGLEDGADYVTIRNTYVHNNVNQGIQSFLRNSDFAINNHILIEKCRLEDNGDSGVKVYGSSNVVVQDNLFRDNGDFGVLVWDYRTVTGYVLDDVQILRNQFFNNCDNIKLDGGDTAGIITNAVVAFNEIHSGDRGVYLKWNVASPQVYDNEFVDNDLQVDDKSGTLDIEVVLANNTFDRAVVVDHASLLHTIWSSIQDGIDAAVSGDTINVAAGTYTATSLASIVITKDNLSLIGESRDETIIDAGTWGTSSAGWPKGIHVYANNVTIKNFTVQDFTGDGTSTGGYGILFRDYDHDMPDEGYIYYTGCVVDNVKSQNNCYPMYALVNRNLTIQNCLIQNNLSDGMFIARESDNATITGNTVINSGDHGIWVGKCWEGHGPSNNAIITNNTVDGAREGGISFVASDGATISGNTITNVAGEIYGIGALSLKDSPSNVEAFDNTIYNNDGSWGEYSGTGHGVGIDGTPSDIHLHDNNIYGNTGDGCYNYSTVLVSAASNWWGNATGPKQAATNPCATGDGVSDNVDYTPWLDAAYPDGSERSYNVRNMTTLDEYRCIQAAIDSASDFDTITVAEGTYDEQVVIDKQLTLNGANADVNAVTGTRGSESVIYGETSTAITISADAVIVDGFTLDGGITLDDTVTVNPISGGTISNNIITGADNPEEPIKAENGIRVGFDNNGKGVDGITIENNTIINSLCKGIRFSNTKLDFNDPHDPQRISNITISGNEIKDNGSAGMETYGPGPNTIINNIISGNDGNGMNLKFDDGDVVTGNTITNNTGPGITMRQVTNTVVENNSVSGHVSEEVINTCDTVPGGKGSGIHIFDTSEDNTIRFNDISGNNYGIFIHSKGDLQPSGNSINFNNIYGNINNIYGNINYGILNALVDPPAPVDATNNWWGTKAKGLIKKMVSDNVDYDPWIGAKAKDSKSKKTGTGDDTVNATDTTGTTVSKKGKGNPTITVTEYTDNPGDGAPGGFSSTGKYIDVHLDDTTDVDEIEIRNYYTEAEVAGLDEATLKLSWWNGTAWIECSDSGATYPDGGPTYRGYVWAKIRADTIPTLDDMAGTAFMSMGRPPAPPPPPAVGDGGGGGGGPAPTPAGTTDVRGMVSTAGRFWYSVTAISEDELCKLTIPRGTVGLTEELEPLTEITMLIMDEPPAPPEDAHVVGLAYDFNPDGATFDPAITLTWSYDPADIPDGIAEEDLVIAYYVAGEWVELEGCVVDTENDTITVPVSHFTTFVIVGAVTPPPPPAPAAFSVTDLSIQPAEVEPNESVTIRLSVANTGGTEGSYSVVLMINGVKEAEKSVTVAAGSSEIVSFAVTREEAASYSVVVDGLSSSFTVVTPPLVPAPAPAPPPVKPINWPLIGGIIGGVVVAGLLVFFLVRRKWLA